MQVHSQQNHIEPEKMAFERRLLLGDPDWSMRTAADRNTLPRKKGDGGVPLSGSESEYYDRGPGPPPGPMPPHHTVMSTFEIPILEVLSRKAVFS